MAVGQTEILSGWHETIPAITQISMPGREIEPRSEAEPQSPYVRAARYASDAPALAAYTRAQEAIFAADCDLSAYRIRFRENPYVVVLGLTPPEEVKTTLEAILEAGEAATLPRDVIGSLTQRRAEARRLGPWVEGHYRPGRSV